MASPQTVQPTRGARHQNNRLSFQSFNRLRRRVSTESIVFSHRRSPKLRPFTRADSQLALTGDYTHNVWSLPHPCYPQLL
jgi:hypothetical protein